MARIRSPYTWGVPQQTGMTELPDVYGPTKPTNNTGVSGYGPGGTPPPPVDPPATTENRPNGPEPGPTNTGWARTAANNPGLDLAKWTSGHMSPKYAWAQVASQNDMSTDAGRQAALAMAKSQFPDWFGNASLNRDILSGLNHADFNGIDSFDVIRDYGGENGLAWQGLGGAGQGGQQAPQGTGGGVGTGQGGGGLDLAAMMEQFSGLFGQQGQEYGPPADSGVYPGEDLQQVGQDPFSQLINGGLAALINTGGQGFSETGDAANDALQQMLSDRDGGFNEDIINKRMESARENAERWRSGQMDTLEAGLADRGLIGSGPERTGMERIGLEMEGIGATALRDIFADESGAADGRMMQALGLGLQSGESNNRTLLDTLGQGHERQMGLSAIALESLNQNMEWQQFLAEFGLDRAKVAEEMAQGRMETLIPLIQMFIQMAQTSAGGYIK